METRRICPRCRKSFPKDEVVCGECGERLIDVAPDYEACFAMVREPVLLTNGHKVDTVYLEEALRKKNIPYYVEAGENVVPTGYYKKGFVEIVAFTNYYVDKSNWKAAKEALKNAVEETRKDEEAPVVFLDMPEKAPEDSIREPGAGLLEHSGENQETGKNRDAGEEGDRSLWGWFVDQDMVMKAVLGVISLLFLLGLARIIIP